MIHGAITVALAVVLLLAYLRQRRKLRSIPRPACVEFTGLRDGEQPAISIRWDVADKAIPELQSFLDQALGLVAKGSKPHVVETQGSTAPAAVIVVGDPFADDSPRTKQEQAKKLVKAALAEDKRKARKAKK